MTAHRLHSPADPHFAECWQLYEASFPVEERRSLACQRAAMAEQGQSCAQGQVQESGSFHCLRLEQGGSFAGIAFYWQSPQFIYVEHLAIAPERRGQGLGHMALDILRSLGLPLILEIEPVADAATERRWRFYRSAGFHRLPFAHLQPLYHRGDAPMALELLSYPHAMTAPEVDTYEAFMRSTVSRYTEAGQA